MFGGLLTGLEALAFSATVESAIEKEIWENKIEALIKQHEG